MFVFFGFLAVTSCKSLWLAVCDRTSVISRMNCRLGLRCVRIFWCSFSHHLPCQYSLSVFTGRVLYFSTRDSLYILWSTTVLLSLFVWRTGLFSCINISRPDIQLFSQLTENKHYFDYFDRHWFAIWFRLVGMIMTHLKPPILMILFQRLTLSFFSYLSSGQAEYCDPKREDICSFWKRSNS